jgi:hypothetical protein
MRFILQVNLSVITPQRFIEGAGEEVLGLEAKPSELYDSELGAQC